MHLRVDLLLHIIIGILHLADDGAFTVFLVHPVCTALDETLAVFEGVTVVVTDDIAHTGLFDVRLDVQQMIKALIAFSGLWCLVSRQQPGKLGSEGIGIDHLPLCVAGMHADAFYGDLG